MLAMGTLWVILFWGGWAPIVFLGLSFIVPSSLILITKALIIWVFFIVVRALVPRYRFDQVIYLGWTAFLPVFLGFLIFSLGLLKFFSANLMISDIMLFVEPHCSVGHQVYLQHSVECKLPTGQYGASCRRLFASHIYSQVGDGGPAETLYNNRNFTVTHPAARRGTLTKALEMTYNTPSISLYKPASTATDAVSAKN